MGCHNSKNDENVQKYLRLRFWKKRHKVVSIGEEKTTQSADCNDENTIRRTKQTVLMQLKSEGIDPKKGSGGVAFVVEISEASPSSVLPGVPESDSYKCATYSQTPFPRANLPPRRLPPIINRIVIEAKQERARKNRERKITERKSKCVKSSISK
ncbi:uncharacterized protein [Argopecten irradians]|uniref:uncharacterized protein n=1 Tax=Argopecten irradians TaxID=31199 RepID=UPI00371DA3D8